MDENIGQVSGMGPSKTPVMGGTPYFMGDQALVKFSLDGSGGESTYWLVNKKKKTIQPFESMKALQAAFKEGYPEALKNAVAITVPVIDEGGEITDGVLSGFNVLDPEYAIKNDGSSKRLAYSPHSLKKRYGKPVDTKAEGMAVKALEGFFNILKQKEDITGISPKFIDKLKKDSKLMAFYISSLAYGNYTLNDIYKEIVKEKESIDGPIEKPMATPEPMMGPEQMAVSGPAPEGNLESNINEF